MLVQMVYYNLTYKNDASCSCYFRSMCIPITLNCYTLTYGIVEHVLMTWRRSRVSFINDLCIIVADPNTVIYLLLLGCMCDFLRIPFYSLYIRITMQLRTYTHRGDFWFFKHLKVIENRRMDLVRLCLNRLFRRLRFRWLNWNT